MLFERPVVSGSKEYHALMGKGGKEEERETRWGNDMLLRHAAIIATR